MTRRRDEDWLPTFRSYAAIGPPKMRVKAAAIVAEIEARLAEAEPPKPKPKPKPSEPVELDLFG